MQKYNPMPIKSGEDFKCIAKNNSVHLVQDISSLILKRKKDKKK